MEISAFFSSLHNIIFNSFRLVLVLWSLLPTNRAFYFFRHSCSKKFLFLIFKILPMLMGCSILLMGNTVEMAGG